MADRRGFGDSGEVRKFMLDDNWLTSRRCRCCLICLVVRAILPSLQCADRLVSIGIARSSYFALCASYNCAKSVNASGFAGGLREVRGRYLLGDARWVVVRLSFRE